MTAIYKEIERVVHETARQRLAETQPPDGIPFGMWQQSQQVAAMILADAGRQKPLPWWKRLAALVTGNKSPAVTGNKRASVTGNATRAA
jgi:hypothetical protein